MITLIKPSKQDNLFLVRKAYCVIYTAIPGNKFEGELVAMDEPSGMIIIKSTGTDNMEDLTVLNRELLSDFEVKTPAPKNSSGKR